MKISDLIYVKPTEEGCLWDTPQFNPEKLCEVLEEMAVDIEKTKEYVKGLYRPSFMGNEDLIQGMYKEREWEK
jgi:hypothetical protein